MRMSASSIGFAKLYVGTPSERSDHVVAELGVLEAHGAAHEVVDDALALVGHAEADHRGIARGLARGALLRAQARGSGASR